MTQYDRSPTGDAPRGPDPYTRETVRVTPGRVIAAVLVVVALIFVVQNGDRVDVRFLFIRAEDVSLWFVIVVSLLVGVLIGWLLGRRGRRRD